MINNNKIFKVISIYFIVFAICTLGFGFAVSGIGFKNESEKPISKYNVNKNNETYGSLSKAISVETEPDLVLVQCEDGTIGYVKNEDLKEKEPKNPEEALQMQKEKEKRIKEAKENGVRPGKEINVYDVNGEKVIGKFFITEGDEE